jgi:hypothetical protein
MNGVAHSGFRIAYIYIFFLSISCSGSDRCFCSELCVITDLAKCKMLKREEDSEREGAVEGGRELPLTRIPLNANIVHSVNNKSLVNSNIQSVISL